MIRPKLALFTILISFAYFGLAVYGAGGFAAFFSHPPLIVLLISGLAMVAVALFSPGNISPGEREDRANRWVLGVFAVIGIMAGYLPAYTDRTNFWTFDGDAVRWFGVVLFAVGGAMRIWPVFILGPRFSGLVAIQPGHKLVTTGIYRLIRNPSYTGMLINALGWAFAFRSGVGVILTALFILPLLARIHSEEKLLRSQFGAEYDGYCTKTPWRLIPGIY
jgi:protein-S-isoprenylcysteine O-methyltransferase Ste14